MVEITSDARDVTLSDCEDVASLVSVSTSCESSLCHTLRTLGLVTSAFASLCVDNVTLDVGELATSGDGLGAESFFV